MNQLSIVLVNYNTRDLTLRCLETIYQNAWKASYQVIMVDNASKDGTVIAVRKKYPQVKIIESPKNLGFTGGNNLALKNINSEYCLLLNTDTELLPGSLDNMLDFAKENKYQISTCKLLNPDGSLQPNAGDIPVLLPLFLWISGIDDLLMKIKNMPTYHYHAPLYEDKLNMEVGWVQGAAMLIKTEIFQKIGYLDENIFMYCEDVDFCWRAKMAGYKVGWTSSARITHIGGASSGSPKYSQWSGEFKSLIYLYRKYYGALSAIMLKVMLFIFIIARMFAFFILGRRSYAKTYAKIAVSI